MATLQPSDYHDLRQALYQLGAGKEELKALASLPSEPQILAIFQAVEDRMVAAAQLAKGDIETILGVTITNAFLAKIVKAWVVWRMRS